MRKRWAVIAIVAGGAGVLLFCPLPAMSPYCCVADWLASGARASNPGAGVHTSEPLPTPKLLQRYFIPFAWLWWGSLLVLFLGLRGALNNRATNTNRDAGYEKSPGTAQRNTKRQPWRK